MALAFGLALLGASSLMARPTAAGWSQLTLFTWPSSSAGTTRRIVKLVRFLVRFPDLTRPDAASRLRSDSA